MKKIVGITVVVLAFILSMNLKSLYSSENNIFAGKNSDEIIHLFNEKRTQIKNSSKSNQEKAIDYAELGQTALEFPEAAKLASDAFEDAISMDKENSIANFYSALLKPVFTLKGFSLRVAKILPPTYMSDLTFNYIDQIKNSAIKKIVSELLNNPKPGHIFRSVSEYQRFALLELLPVLEESKRKLDIISPLKDFKSQFNYSYWSNAKLWSGHGFFVLFDQIDVYSARESIYGLSALIKFTCSYNLDDLPEIQRILQERSLTTQEIFNEYNKYPKLFTLTPEAPALLKSILDHASNSIEGLHLIANMLKATPDRSKNLFPTFKDGEFIKMDKILSTIAEYISGPTGFPIEKKNLDNTVLMNATTFFSKPIPDIKKLFPTEFTEDGEIPKSFPDLTFGGLFPNSDLISHLCAIKKKIRTIRMRLYCDALKEDNK